MKQKTEKRKRVDFTLSPKEYALLEEKRDKNGYSTNKDYVLDLVTSRETTDRRFNKQMLENLTNLNYLLKKSEQCNNLSECKNIIDQTSEEVMSLWTALLRRPI